MEKKNNDNAQAFLALLGIPVFIALIIIAIIPIGIFNSWVIQKLYIWFLVQPLHAPALNLWHIYGLVLLINLLKGTSSNDNKKSVAQSLGSIAGSIFAALLVLLIAWLIKGHI